MDIAFFDAFDRALDGAMAHQPHVILIEAEGAAFCAGFDLAACAADPLMAARLVDRLGALTQRIRAFPAVVIAAVGGPALAGGCALVASCDLVIASPGARFGYPVHRIGISPAVSLPVLSRSLGGGAARALALGGRIVDAEAAERLGLVHQCIVGGARLGDVAGALAGTIARHGPNALRATKRWLNELDGSTDPLAAGAATHASMSTAGSEEARRMIAAYWAAR